MDRCAALARMRFVLQHERGRAFAEHQAGAALVERLAARRRICGVGRRERAQRLPCGERARREQRFGAAGHHRVGASGDDGAHRFAERHRRRGAGGRVVGERAAQAVAHGDVRAGGVVHRHHHGQRAHAPLALAVDLLVARIDRDARRPCRCPTRRRCGCGRRRRGRAGSRRAPAPRCAERELRDAVEVGGFAVLEQRRRAPLARWRRPARRSRGRSPRAAGGCPSGPRRARGGTPAGCCRAARRRRCR